MTTTAHVVEWVWGIASGAAFGVGTAMSTMQTPGIAGVPWEMVSGAGVAGALVLSGWFFLRRDTESQKQHAAQLDKRDDTIKAIAKEFSDTSTNITNTFALTTKLSEESRKASDERAERREKELRDWMQALTRDRA